MLRPDQFEKSELTRVAIYPIRRDDRRRDVRQSGGGRRLLRKDVERKQSS